MDTKEYYLDDFVDYLNKNDKSSGTISTYTTNINDFIKYYTESYGEKFIPGNVIMMDSWIRDKLKSTPPERAVYGKK